MSTAFPDAGAEFHPLHRDPRAIALEAGGFRHPTSPRGRGRGYTPYAELTHLAISQRALWIGTRRSVYILPRRAFTSPAGPERLVNALIERVAHRPGGAEQLERMAQAEELARQPAPLRATWVLAGLCLGVFALQLALGTSAFEVGYFSSLLVVHGEFWRVLTSNLLHAAPQFPVHLLLNLLGLLALGALLERPLGAARTVCVMVASALGSAAGSGWAGYSAVVGASGIVFGLAGAVLWLEVRRADQLPAWWRFPRRPLLVILAVNAVLGLALPFIAGAAHLGGFAAGFAAAAAVGWRGPGLRPAPTWVRAAASTAGLAVLVSLGAAGGELFVEGDYLARHAARLAGLPRVDPIQLNDRAWLIAISPDSPPARIEAALLLAERAVEETGRSEPTILDTLAELQFLLGSREAALATIDEAIAGAPDEPYYREQRRRFAGERAPDDRPAPPLPGGPGPGEQPLPVDPEEPGITV